MKRIVIFGNSGSGKSTLAKELKEQLGLGYLDLDSIAWEPLSPPTRKPIEESKIGIDGFMESNAEWVIEGCYADLLAIALPEASEIIYLDLSVEACIDNAKRRPWEPHKYESKDAQDGNLAMLVEWISQYEKRDDEFSKSAHKRLVEAYKGKKTIYTCNKRSG